MTYRLEIIPIGFSYKKLLVETTTELMKVVEKHIKDMLNSPDFDPNIKYTSPITKNSEYVKVSISGKMESLIVIGEPLLATIQIKNYTISKEVSITKSEIKGFYIQLIGFKKKQ